MRALAAAALLALLGCSSEKVLDSHGTASGELTFTVDGIPHKLEKVTSVTFDVGIDRKTTLLRMEVLFQDPAIAFFALVTTSALTITGQPSISAPFSYVAEYPDRLQGARARLPLIGDLRAANVYLVCEEENQMGLCAVGTEAGRLEISTSTMSATHAEGVLEFQTEPRLEDAD